MILGEFNMVRMSKQGKRRAQYPKKRRAPSEKTGPLQDKLADGYKHLANAVSSSDQKYYIAKVK